MGDDAPFLHIVHQVPSYSPPTHLFSLNYLVWIIYTLDTLKEKNRNLFTWCELKGKVMSTAKCILKIKGVGAIWRKKCSFPCPWNHLWLLTHLHRRQFLFWKLWRHWKPLRMFTTPVLAWQSQDYGSVYKIQIPGCTTGDFDSVGLWKGSKDGWKKVNK